MLLQIVAGHRIVDRSSLRGVGISPLPAPNGPRWEEIIVHKNVSMRSPGKPSSLGGKRNTPHRKAEAVIETAVNPPGHAVDPRQP